MKYKQKTVHAVISAVIYLNSNDRISKLGLNMEEPVTFYLLRRTYA